MLSGKFKSDSISWSNDYLLQNRKGFCGDWIIDGSMVLISSAFISNMDKQFDKLELPEGFENMMCQLIGHHSKIILSTLRY